MIKVHSPFICRLYLTRLFVEVQDEIFGTFGKSLRLLFHLEVKRLHLDDTTID